MVLSALDSLTKEQKSLAGFTKVVDTIVTSTSNTKRSRNSVLLKSIDDSYIMECTNFFTASSTPEIFVILQKHSATSKHSSPAKLDPMLPLHPTKSLSKPSANGSKETGKTHDQHIHGMKLLKKVGSFKFSDDLESHYGNAMLSPHLEEVEVSLRLAKDLEINSSVGEEGVVVEGGRSARNSGVASQQSVGQVKARYLMETKASKKKITTNLKRLDRKKSWNHADKKPTRGVLGAITSSHPDEERRQRATEDGLTEGDKDGVSKKKKGGKKKEKLENIVSTEENKRSDEDEAETAVPEKHKVMTRIRNRKQQSGSNESNIVLEKEISSSMHKRMDNIRSISEKYNADLTDINK
ncbi:hypothetical protein EON65_38155 [archaeon]|nr:MAG: hypothetical protein EON65_38155 [archaeon]